MTTRPGIDQLIGEIVIAYERSRAESLFFPTRHDGFGWITLHLGRLWHCIMADDPSYAVWHEAIQVAAMCLKFLLSMSHWDS